METGDKLYYSIKEVAERFGINASRLRYYEQKFPTLQPKKKTSGSRVYTQTDIDHLAEILDLIDRQKFTLPGARAFLKTRDDRRRENARIVTKLRHLKTFLEQMRDELNEPPT